MIEVGKLESIVQLSDFVISSPAHIDFSVIIWAVKFFRVNLFHMVLNKT